MKFLRNGRRLAAVGAVGLAAAATLFVVVPAIASAPGDYVKPPSAANVLPYDVALGGNGTCSNLFTGAHTLPAGIHEYDNSNPKTATGAKSGNGDGVTFDLTVHSPSSTSQRSLPTASAKRQPASGRSHATSTGATSHSLPQLQPRA